MNCADGLRLREGINLQKRLEWPLAAAALIPTATDS